jgi:hypothetical protein
MKPSISFFVRLSACPPVRFFLPLPAKPNLL